MSALDQRAVETRVLCRWCRKREAVMHFGNMLTFTHNPDLNCCQVCALTMQLDHAKERAAAIPALREALAEALASEASAPGTGADQKDGDSR